MALTMEKAQAAPVVRQVAREFGTPCVVIDLDVVEANIAKLQARCDELGVANRPHIKTHKSPQIAKMQVAAGARGITCQKLGEAEVMGRAGLTDILISYNLLGEALMPRLARLADQVSLTVAADNFAVIDGYGVAAASMSRPLSVVVECDTGRKRAGVASPQEAVDCAVRIAGTPGLAFEGLLYYPPEDGWAATSAFHEVVLEGLRAHGLKATIVSTGGTPNLPHVGQFAAVTEHRAGTSVYNDRMMLRARAATQADLALHVVSTVVSRAEPSRGILDAGSKTLTSDTGGLDGFGLIRECPEARIGGLSEEHGFLDLARCPGALEVGDVVRVAPNHVCVVVNMVDEVIAVRGNEIVGPMAVEARGRIR